jgi:hypothetical protein
MHEYDITLKLLFRNSPSVLLRELTGVRVAKWLDGELPRQNLRVDLLGEARGGALLHLEMQSTNISKMAERMLEYYVGIHRLTGRFPRQLCLYVGEPKLTMRGELVTPNLRFRYPLIDIRSFDGEVLLDSPNIGDNVIAVLTRLRDKREAIRRVLSKAAMLSGPARQSVLRQLISLAGLRHLEDLLKQETENMPIQIDISKNKILGPVYKRGLQKGELTLLRRQLQKRFGRLPAWATERLAAKSSKELEKLGLRILDATTLEELLQ